MDQNKPRIPEITIKYLILNAYMKIITNTYKTFVFQHKIQTGKQALLLMNN